MSTDRYPSVETVFRIETAQHAGAMVIVVHGEIDMLTAPELAEQLGCLEDGAPSAFVIDLGDVQFIDSSGLRVILRAQRAATAHGHRLSFRRGTPQVQRLFDVTEVTGLLTFEDTPD